MWNSQDGRTPDPDDEEREANLRRVQSLQRQIWEVKGE
jgi:hypothetical protein